MVAKGGQRVCGLPELLRSQRWLFAAVLRSSSSPGHGAVALTAAAVSWQRFPFI